MYLFCDQIDCTFMYKFCKLFSCILFLYEYFSMQICKCDGCFRPQLFVYDDLLKNDNETNLEHAFGIAQDNLNIDRLLEPEGIN